MARQVLRDCGYCGAPRAGSKDHVPPLSLFAKPRPSNLVTVPACSECHRGTGKDDEYFRTCFALREDIAEHSAIAGEQGLTARTLRGLSRPQQRGLLNEVWKTVKPVQVKSPGGIWMPKTAYLARTDRILPCVRRIFRGLYFHETGRVLGLDRTVKVISDDFTDWSSTNDEMKDIVRRVVGHCLAVDEHAIGGNVCRYRLAILPEDPSTFAGLLTFYDVITFLGAASEAGVSRGPDGRDWKS